MKYAILIASIFFATTAAAEVEINCYRSGDVTDTDDQQLSIRGQCRPLHLPRRRR